MADGAVYIRTAASKVWPRVRPVMCRFHFWKSIKPKLTNKEYILRPKLQNGRIQNQDIPASILSAFSQDSSLPADQRFNPIRIIRFDIKVLMILPNKLFFDKYIKFIQPFWMYFGSKFWSYFNSTYIDESNADCLSGWQNYIKSNYPTTNNSLEAFNRVMKDVVSHHTKLPIEKYVENMSVEIKRRSTESAEIINFPKIPKIFPAITIFGITLADKHNNYFKKINNCYYIMDRYLTFSMYNPKRGTIKKQVKELSSKISGKHDESINKFYSYFNQPSDRDIALYESGNLSTRSIFLRILHIRKIKLSDSQSQEELINQSSCTCPDWYDRGVCPHILACLKAESRLSLDLQWKRNKRRGRKARVPGALQRDNVENV